MLGIPSPPAHGGSWAVSKSTTVFFWYPFFQMKSFTAFCSVLIRFSSNCGMIWTTWVNFDSCSPHLLPSNPEARCYLESPDCTHLNLI